jgi:hypothetical protein
MVGYTRDAIVHNGILSSGVHLERELDAALAEAAGLPPAR